MNGDCNGLVSNESKENGDMAMVQNRADNNDQPQQNNDENRIAHLARQVFGYDMLREMILTLVIQNDGASKHDIWSLRLVQKSWMKDVSRIMKKLGKPLCNLKLHKHNSLNASSYVREFGIKVLDNFVNTVARSPSTIENAIPPFSMSIDLDFFQHENRQSFSDFFTSGSVAGLLELEMKVPANGGSMDFVFGHIPLFFPALQRLSVEFCEEKQNTVKHGSNSYFLPFLQSILHGANQLKIIACPFSSRDAVIPTGINSLTLPASVTHLELECTLTSDELEVLATNVLPNLTHLMLPIHHIVFSNHLIFRILDLYKDKLQALYFHGIYLEKDDLPKAVTHFHFPVMTCLQGFSSNSIHAELQHELQDPPLQSFLPTLSILHLTEQSVDMIRKWTGNSCFETVSTLKVGLVKDNVCGEGRREHEISIPLEEMQSIHNTFPNVSVLEIFITGVETCAFKYLLREMKQLTELTVRVLNSFIFTNSNHWDSLLTGIPIHIVKTLGESPELVGYDNDRIDSAADMSSLTNLSALRSLRLIAPLPKKMTILISPSSLISNAVFHLAFLKMPNLKQMLLAGKFMASPEITRVWEAEQRTITYYRELEE